MTATMQAWVQDRFGGPEVWERREVPMPIPGHGELLIKVKACAVNRLDIIQRIGPSVLPDRFTFPHIAGMDIVGQVVEANSPLHESYVGRTVIVDPGVMCGHCVKCVRGYRQYCDNMRAIGSTRDGGFADYVTAPASNVVPINADKVDPVLAACLPVTGTTAWQSLLVVAKIRGGETVLIPAAGSGVGSMAIQIAKSAGCTVFTTVGDESKVDRAIAIGADHVLLRTDPNWVERIQELTDGEGVDVAMDHVGGRFLQQAINATGLEGRVAMTGSTDGLQAEIRVTSIYHWGRKLLGQGTHVPGVFRDLVAAFEGGRITPIIDSVWDMEHYPEAEAKLERSEAFGKIVMVNSD